jgi:hypothetical protein
MFEMLSSAPEPQQDKFGTIAPYEVDSEFEVSPSRHELGDSRSSFIDVDLGLEVDLAIHACRPRAADRVLNVIDGSTIDQCTSGGVLTIVDLQQGEKFEIYFKLVGAPNGMIGWNARQLVSPRGMSGMWHDSLDTLRHRLPQYEPPGLPPSVSRAAGRLEARAIDAPHTLLLSGNEEEMLRLLAFRGVFREFYENPNSHQAKYVTRMLIDTLLDSPEQQALSERWRRELGAAD